jgi:UPF0755 protein
MSRFLGFVAASFAVILACIFAGGFWAIGQINAPSAIETQSEFLIDSGKSGRQIADDLDTAGLVQRPDFFYMWMRLKGDTVKAGEYEIPARSSIKQIYDILASGKTVQRHITLPEGFTVKQAAALINGAPYLEGEITDLPDEGSLLPETYSYTRNETRKALIKRMQAAHDTLLDELWDNRDTSLPLKSKDEAVVLASIVEKETGKAEERPKIAGLFYNRLKIGMPLQTDPTVVYVITDKLGHMGGKPLLRKHLAVDSPYNTYKVVGLPPGPIANPGKASLEAVFKPETHNYLFFVADGTGGHIFSESLAGHNKNVLEWRKIKRDLNRKAAADANPAKR